MDPNILKTVIAQVHRRFPELAGAQPKVRRQSPPQSSSAAPTPTFLLMFHSSVSIVSGEGKRSLPRWVRVVVSEKGKILKITTSR